MCAEAMRHPLLVQGKLLGSLVLIAGSTVDLLRVTNNASYPYTRLGPSCARSFTTLLRLDQSPKRQGSDAPFE